MTEPRDIDALRARLEGTRGREYWRSLEALAETPEFKEFLHREFPQTRFRVVRHAVELFIVHDPEAARLAIPPIPPPAEKRAAAQLAGAIGREAALDWFREDPLANDHHRHWHIVYPARGRPEPGRPAAAGPPGRAVLLHAPADARPLRRRAARARLRPRRAVRRLPRADRRGLRGPPERPGAARRRPPGHRPADRRRARAAARPPARRGHRRRGRRTAPARCR